MGRRRLSPRRALAIAAGIVLVLALLPTRYSKWVGWFGRPTMIAIGPAAEPINRLAQWALPRRTGPAQPEQVEALTQEVEKFRTMWRQSEARLADSERRLADIQRGRALNPNLDLAPIVAPVIGSAADPSSGLLRARAGRDRGVQRDDVVVVGGVHLVGKVVDASALECSILPITQRGAGYIEGVVDVPGVDAAALPRCQLLPGPGGELSGEFERDAAGVDLGLLVRLRDPGWPASAQMLVIGKVVAIRPKESQPLRQVIVVRPEMDFRRLGEALIYASGPAASAPEGATP